ncbi:tryptophan 2,3-dioxygenase, partial [Xanthomonas perforans]
MPIVHTDFLRGTCARISLAPIPSGNPARAASSQPGPGIAVAQYASPSAIRHPPSANPESRI